MRWTRASLLAGLMVTHAAVAEELSFEPVELTPPRYFLLLKRDVTTIAAAPLEWDRTTWTKVAVGAGIVGALMLADVKIREEVVRHSDERIGKVADAVEPFGSDYSWAILGAFYGAGKLFENERALAVAQDGFASSVIAAGIITPALKSIAGRSRPSQSERNYAFGEDGVSFPSGHTTQAFAVASVIAEHYNSRWVDGVAYGLATMVGYARVEDRAHFASDVVAGALIGVAVGKSVVRLHASERRRFSVEPMITSDGGAGLSVRFSTRRR